jgi:caffeoyl-CoA O-methyltransferase
LPFDYLKKVKPLKIQRLYFFDIFFKSKIISDNMDLDQYITAHTASAGELLDALQRETYLKVLQPHMISGKVQGRLLAMISKIIQPKYILEIGAFTGYATLCLAEGLRADGHLHTIEANDELQEIITRYIKQAQRETQITLHIGQALEIIPALACTFDITS